MADKNADTVEVKAQVIKPALREVANPLRHELAAAHTAYDLLVEAQSKAADAEKGDFAKPIDELATKIKDLKDPEKVAKRFTEGEHGTNIKGAIDAFLKDEKTNPQLAQATIHQDMASLAKEHGEVFVADKHLDAVKAHLPEGHKGLATAETVEKHYAKGLDAANDVLPRATEPLKKLAEPKVEQGMVKGFAARVAAEKNRVMNGFNHGVDVNGEKLKFGKAGVYVGGAIALGGVGLGLKDMYVGVAGRTDPETGENTGASFGRVVVGAGEMAAGLLAAQKLATGRFSVAMR